MGYVASSRAVRAEMARLAENAGVECLTPRSLEISRVHEAGMEVSINHKQHLRPKALLLGGDLPEATQKLLGLPESWGPDVVHRYTYLKLAGKKWADVGSRPVIPMSLNLRDTLCWGWLLPGPKSVQIAISQPLEMLPRVPANDLLMHWARVLRGAGVLLRDDLPLDHVESMDLPLTGALAHEGVANRTLLIGPAGGFYTQCAEDVYPNCWSSVHAVDAVRKALKEPHLQDALNPYRSKWRTTLGQYLRGPQQDFRFLLPLIYRNEVMTTRLTESILHGKSVVR
jgi:flavin-dependent dehydrogenase